jgi:hypothetical protein
MGLDGKFGERSEGSKLVSRLAVTTALVWLSSAGFAHALCKIPPWNFRIAGPEAAGTMTAGSNEPCNVEIKWTAGNTVIRSVSIASAPVHGTAQAIPKSGLTYRSRPGYRGPDSFTFLVSGHGASCDCEGTARVRFSVTVE